MKAAILKPKNEVGYETRIATISQRVYILVYKSIVIFNENIFFFSFFYAPRAFRN